MLKMLKKCINYLDDKNNVDVQSLCTLNFFLLFFLKAKCTYKKLNIADSQCKHRGKYSYGYKYMTCIYGIVAHVYSAATVNALESPTLDLAEFVSSL